VTQREHLSDEYLLRSIDDELSPSQAVRVATHLNICFECRRRLQEFRALSGEVDAIVNAASVAAPIEGREALRTELEAREVILVGAPGFSTRWLGVGLGLAATLALAILFLPTREHVNSGARASVAARGDSTFEIDGERFQALPYSNPDLPIGQSRIVQMQVPVSALTEAGVMLVPVSDQMAAPDRTVLADILLGMDGQPLGVHVLNSE
jgi:hypothetical protein